MIKLSISNIAWRQENDEAVYSLMQEIGFSGLEIAPTRIFPVNPYECTVSCAEQVKHDKKENSHSKHRKQSAYEWAKDLYSRYKFVISSMQSIWYGKTEKIFGSEYERQELFLYTKKAIDFAEAIGCKNLVFGCPKNRIIPESRGLKNKDDLAVEFFHELGNYAYKHNTAIGMEANPVIYGTNYINTTEEAIDLIKRVNSEGFKLNMDVGTMIYNDESTSVLVDSLDLINHIHISEPYLKVIQKRKLHNEIKTMIMNSYNGFISIEMGNGLDIETIQSCMLYVKEIFCDIQ